MLNRLVAIVTCLAHLSCGGPIYDQVFHGTVHENGRPLANLQLRAGLEMGQGDCSGDFVEGSTNADGEFSLRKAYVPGFVELATVVVHEHYRCARLGGSFTPIWKSRTGPAMRDIRIDCDLRSDGSPAVACRPASTGIISENLDR